MESSVSIRIPLTKAYLHHHRHCYHLCHLLVAVDLLLITADLLLAVKVVAIISITVNHLAVLEADLPPAMVKNTLPLKDTYHEIIPQILTMVTGRSLVAVLLIINTIRVKSEVAVRLIFA